MSRVRSWTDEEVGWLMDHDHLSARVAGEELGRGQKSIQHMREKLRAGGEPLSVWLSSEDEVIRETAHMTAREVIALLPGRTLHAVQTRRRNLGRAEGLRFDTPGVTKDAGHVGKRSLLAKTCPGCELLLTPKWFGKKSDGYWRPRCIRCQPPQDRGKFLAKRSEREGTDSRHDFYVQVQALTKERATKNGQEWVVADHEVLSDPEVTILAKALRLGRTYAATSNMCSANGYASLVGHGDAIKGQWIIDNPNEAA